MPKKLTTEKYDKEKYKLRNEKYSNKFCIDNVNDSELCTLINIGESNVKKWKFYKNKTNIQNDSEFVTYLLKLIEEKFGSFNDIEQENSNSSPSVESSKTIEFSNDSLQFNDSVVDTFSNLKHIHNKNSKRKHDLTSDTKKSIYKINEITKKDKNQSTTEKGKHIALKKHAEVDNCKILVQNNNDNSTSNFIKIIDQKCTNGEENLCANINFKSQLSNQIALAATDLENNEPKNNVLVNSRNNKTNEKKYKKFNDGLKKKQKKLKNHDIRKAPQLDFASTEPVTESVSVPSASSPHPAPLTPTVDNQLSPDVDISENENVKIKIKLCYTCDTRHVQDICPILNPVGKILDSITLQEWTEKSNINDNDDNAGEKETLSYAVASLPQNCYLEEINSKHGLSVFAKNEIDKYIEMGPLIGSFIKEVDIADDFNMKYIWELKFEGNNYYINTEDPSNSNWIRYVRPAETREKRNVTAITRNKQIYLVTSSKVNEGDELRYWTDDSSNLAKKRLEKTNCGGCNLTFEHALYYRTHCSIFHDARYSLTIRKYHCKVCGQAVLGKDNIVRHAAELHNGQGAYQCQFCKKNVRLCSKSTSVSALCDFCGRKFCQPQKLKVHIKRMHSDISLSEFQCPLCLKLLGSRAAVQRHAREVHRNSTLTDFSPSLTQNNSSQVTSLSCSRCGKLFQNKSNLKIHMLTHSGVKPFRCKEDNCNAAFTTKQCLQFHYKKVHGFSEDMMPTIERSVEYTFEAYSGGQATDEDIAPTITVQKSTKSSSKIQNNSSKENSNKYEEMLEKSKESSSFSVSNYSKIDSPITEDLPDYDGNKSDIMNSGTTLLSKGSKKWLGNDTNVTPAQNELYNFEENQPSQQANDDASSVILEVDETQQQSENNSVENKFTMCLNVYNPRHDSSNASLLVEAALDSVSDIHMNTESNQNCADNLVVSNMYSLSQQDNNNYINTDLPVDREVTSADYEALQNEEFSAPSSPSLPSHLIHEYVVPRNRNDYHSISRSPTIPHSPPRYDFNQTLNTDNISNDSDGIVAQNLTTNNKDKNRLEQLDFTSYKNHYGDLDGASLSMSVRKYDSVRNKFDLQTSDDRDPYNINIDVTNERKSYDNALSNEQYPEVLDTSDLKNPTVEECRSTLDSDTLRALKYDLESKYEIELRNKGYDSLEADDLRNKVIYDSTLETDLRPSKSYNFIDTEFRTDRSFEPLILNSAELQGLDMSARSYHGFHSTGRYHHMYAEPEREAGVGGYGPPTDVLRVVSLDLTSQSRHGSLHGLHGHHGLLSDHSRLTLDQTRLISTDHNLSVALLGTESRLLSDHTTNRLLSNDQLSEPRLSTSPDAHRMLSGRGFSSYSVSPAAYHPSPLATRSHISSPTHNPPYHHYSGYY